MGFKHSFLKTAEFDDKIADLRAEEELNELLKLLDQWPDTGKIIPGGQGLRKIRMGLPGRGKRGGARIIYYDIVNAHTILLLMVYAKNEQQNLDKPQLAQLIHVKNASVLRVKEYEHGKDCRSAAKGHARTNPKRHV